MKKGNEITLYLILVRFLRWRNEYLIFRSQPSQVYSNEKRLRYITIDTGWKFLYLTTEQGVYFSLLFLGEKIILP